MITWLKKRLLLRIALLSRSYRLYRFDRIWRLILNPDKDNQAHLNGIYFIGNNFWQISTRSYLEWTLFFYGAYEEQIQKLFTHYLKAGDIAIDVGSNIGIHTMHMSRCVGTTGTIISFEPHEKIYQRQINNLTLNQINNVRALQVGLSNKNCTAFLEQFDQKSSSNQGTSKIVSDETTNVMKIRVVRLDDFLTEILQSLTAKIALIKIDIEGHEDAFFEGAEHTIKKHRPIIIFEDSAGFLINTTSSINKMLDCADYMLFGIDFNSLHPIDLKSRTQRSYYRILALPNSDIKKESPL